MLNIQSKIIRFSLMGSTRTKTQSLQVRKKQSSKRVYVSKDEAELQKAFRMTPTAPIGRRQSVWETHTSGSNSSGGMTGLDSEDKRAGSLRGTWNNHCALKIFP